MDPGKGCFNVTSSSVRLRLHTVTHTPTALTYEVDVRVWVGVQRLRWREDMVAELFYQVTI